MRSVPCRAGPKRDGKPRGDDRPSDQQSYDDAQSEEFHRLLLSCSIVEGLHSRSSPNSPLRAHVTSRSLKTTAWLVSGENQEQRDEHAGLHVQAAFDRAVLRGQGPDGAHSLPLLAGRADRARDRHALDVQRRGSGVHDAECMAAQTRRLFRVGWEGSLLVGGAASDQFPDVDEVRDARPDLARLFAGQTFLIEGVQDVLNQSVGDVGGEVGFREWSVIISSCSHVCTRRSAINNKPFAAAPVEVWVHRRFCD